MGILPAAIRRLFKPAPAVLHTPLGAPFTTPGFFQAYAGRLGAFQNQGIQITDDMLLNVLDKICGTDEWEAMACAAQHFIMIALPCSPDNGKWIS